MIRAAVAAAALVLVPAAAQADDVYLWSTPPSESARCVTGVEVAQVDGTRAEVERLLDGPGYASPFVDSPHARDYRRCGISWERGRVTVLYWPNGMIRALATARWRSGDLELPHAHPRFDPSAPVEPYRPFGGVV